MRSAASLIALTVLLAAGAADAKEKTQAQPAAPAQPKANARIIHIAQQKVQVASCALTEIQASNEKKGIDPKLKKHEAKLTKPPFSSYDTFKLLAEPSTKAEKDKPTSLKLATGGQITLLFKDKLVSQGGKARLRVGIDIDNKDGKRVLSTVLAFGSGDIQFPFSGAPLEKGAVYILGLTCINL